MRNWANNFLKSPICRVNFLGFQSDTWKLQEAGWAISAQQDYMSYGVQLALKHEVAKLYAITHIVDMRAIWEQMQILEKYFEQARRDQLAGLTTFNVKWISTKPMFDVITHNQEFSWNPIDTLPSMQNSRECISMEDYIPFRTIKTDTPEIIIAPETVPQLMEKILILQDPKQKEIRERKRREAWKESNTFDGYDSARDIKAQIICIGA